MKKAEAVLSVKFNSTHSTERLLSICQEDLEDFRKVPGLLQKYYLAEESTGAISGVYIFESTEDREKFWDSKLAKNIPARYGVVASTLRIERYEMALVLNDELLTAN